MSSIKEITDKMVTTLSSWSGLGEIEVLEEYAGNAYTYPKDRSRIVVGVSDIVLEPAGLGGFFGHSDTQEHSGVWADVVFSFSYIFPDNKFGNPYEIFQQLSQCLLESDFGVTQISSRGIKENSSKFANEMIVIGKIKTMITTKHISVPVSNVILKKREVFNE